MKNKIIVFIGILLIGFAFPALSQVGIGTSTPIHDLDVNGTTQTHYLQPGLKSTPYEFLRFGNPGDFWGGFMKNISSPNYGDGDDFAIFTYGSRDMVFRAGNGNIYMQPNGTGRVGIGKLNPASKLDVNGDISWGTAGASLTTNQGAAIELRGTGTPFIDFSNDATIDNDARIILLGDDRLVVTGAEFSVLNTFSAKRVRVTTSGYPDYVFEEDYDLKSLKEVQEHIKEKGHLPGVPSEKEIIANGLDLNDQSMWQMEKIEELFLHTIELNKQVEALLKSNEALLEKNAALESRVEQLEQK